MNKIIVGLTGGIASGKSSAANVFLQHNFEVIDADKIAKDLMQNDSEITTKLAKAFPMAFVEGVICRSKLKELVFDNSSALATLNSIVHPKTLFSLKYLAQKSEKSWVLIVVPLLFETGFYKEVDITINIHANESLRIQRLVKRDNISVDLAKKIISSQLSDEERIRKSDYTIANEQDEQSLHKNIGELIFSLQNKTTK